MNDVVFSDQVVQKIKIPPCNSLSLMRSKAVRCGCAFMPMRFSRFSLGRADETTW